MSIGQREGCESLFSKRFALSFEVTTGLARAPKRPKAVSRMTKVLTSLSVKSLRLSRK